jgi:hypothetical protein
MNVSHDLEVATHREPPRDAVAEALRDESGIETEGELAGEAGNVLVLRRRRNDRVAVLTVDGPFRV